MMGTKKTTGTPIGVDSKGKSQAEKLNLFNDFSFKYIFRREAHKDLLITFLNDLLQGDKKITDVDYCDSELQAEFQDGRNCSFDLLCTDQTGDSYLIEVQTTSQSYIATRMLHYITRLFSAGIEKGDKKYKNIKGVIGICKNINRRFGIFQLRS